MSLPSEQFGLMFVPNGSVQDVFYNPTNNDITKRALFSLCLANPNDTTSMVTMVSVNSAGNIFALEDMPPETSDRDYNDIVFQVRGATAQAVLLDDVLQASWMDWRQSSVGQQILNASPLAYRELYPDITTPQPVRRQRN